MSRGRQVQNDLPLNSDHSFVFQCTATVKTDVNGVKWCNRLVFLSSFWFCRSSAGVRLTGRQVLDASVSRDVTTSWWGLHGTVVAKSEAPEYQTNQSGHASWV